MKSLTYSISLAFVGLLMSVGANANVTETVNLGTHNLPNEVRVHCPNAFNHCRTEVRSVRKKLVLYFTYPSDATVRRHILQCGAVAAATAGVSSLIFTPAVAEAAFEAAFFLCIENRLENDLGDRIDIDLDVETKYSGWSTH